jgi:outer membrane beta-barrel protein
MTRTLTILLLALVALGGADAFAQTSGQKPANEQVIVPQVDRRDVRTPRYPNKDFEIGAFLGTYSAENFGSSLVYGLRLGYHITEDVFVQATYGTTEVSDEAFRRVLPGGIFANPKETLKYYNLSAGYNVLPGEIFLGRNVAKASAVYVIAGIGSTDFISQKKQTINFGLGMRVLVRDRLSVQFDIRDHVYSLDLLGENTSTNNVEFTAGLSWYF